MTESVKKGARAIDGVTEVMGCRRVQAAIQMSAALVEVPKERGSAQREARQRRRASAGGCVRGGCKRRRTAVVGSRAVPSEAVAPRRRVGQVGGAEYASLLRALAGRTLQAMLAEPSEA